MCEMRETRLMHRAENGYARTWSTLTPQLTFSNLKGVGNLNYNVSPRKLLLTLSNILKPGEN